MILEIAGAGRKRHADLTDGMHKHQGSRDQGAPKPGGDKRVRLAGCQTESLVMYLSARRTTRE